LDSKLNVCGVCCPLPLIELAGAVAKLAPGDTLEVIGNDPIFESSVIDFCQANGHEVLEVDGGDARRVVVRIKVGGD